MIPSTSDHPSQTSAAAGDEQLAQLYKMSRTAGLGNNEYVAVNGVSVAAVLFGIGSALVVFDPIFLVIPVVAIVLAVIALYQIRHSGGTQTGRGLGWLAIFAAIACVCVLGSKQIAESYTHRVDEEKIAALVQSLGADLAARNYDAAYARFSTEFTARKSKADFITRWNQLQDGPIYGQVKSMQWNKLATFDVDNRNADPLATTIALVELEGHPGGDREPIVFRKRGDTWMIENIPNLFPVEAPPAAPGSRDVR